MTETPKVGWGAAVQGNPSDIAHWDAALKKPFDPWVESHDKKTLLRSAVLDELQSATEVRDQTVALIDRLNGAMDLFASTASRNSCPMEHDIKRFFQRVSRQLVKLEASRQR